MDCTGCFHHLVYYFIVFLLLSLLWMMDRNVGQYNDHTHKKMAVLFLLCSMKKSQVICHWFFPASPEITLAPPQRLIPLGERRKRGQLHLRLLNKCITVWALCPGLSGPLTWNVPMRQSGAIGAWQLAAGGDNLLWDMEKRAAKDFVAPVDTSLKPWDMPIQSRRESCVTHQRAQWLKELLSRTHGCRFIG